MAIVKHVPSHNARYSDVIDYLTKEHDEDTGKAILDEHGQMIDRKEFLIAGINCTPEDFAELCMKDSIRFNTNRAAADVKTHQYILSFDPKDREKGLTMEEAQREGIEFAERNFPGHRAIVCAHPDGANGAGNIHVHIVICSVRFEDREPKPEYMKLQSDGSVKESEYKAGCKHQDTARLRRYLNEQLQEYCRGKGYTVAEQKPPKKVTNREYKAKAEGQKRLDQENAARRQKGQEPAQTEFKTKKDDLRLLIAHAASISKDWDEFAYNLRNCYSRQVEQRPKQPRIPYKERQDMWASYKGFNDEFWTKHRKLAEIYKEDVSQEFGKLRARKTLARKSRDRRLSLSERMDAEREARWRYDKDEIRSNINATKEKQQKLRLFKDLYQMYSKATKLALSHDMQEEAEKCLLKMEELRRRQDGYWVDGDLKESTERRILADFAGIQSRITWMQTQESELDYAYEVLQRVQAKAREIDASKDQPVIKEEAFSVDVKISRGAISFKHPDLERWTRGKSLGADFELEALAKVMEQNRMQQHEKATEEIPKTTSNRLDEEGSR